MGAISGGFGASAQEDLFAARSEFGISKGLYLCCGVSSFRLR